jgi:1,2-diacylglycerol 3-alpha-glucosyltransferase
MKVVMVCEFYDEKLEYQDNLLAKYYIANGHDVTIITSTIASVFDYVKDQDRGRGDAKAYDGAEGKVIRLPFRVNLLNRIKIFPSLMAILEAEKPDLLFFHDIIPNIVEGAAYIRRHPHAKMIMDYHADYSNSGKGWLSLKVLHGIVRKAFLRAAQRQISGFFPIVPAAAEFLHEVYGIDPARMELLPLGTDLKFGAAVQMAGAGPALRKQLGIAEDAFVVFCGGKLNPLKGTEHLIDAVRSIDDARLRLLVVGVVEPSEAAYGEMLTQRAGGDPRILFRGWQDRASVYAHLDASDVAVFPASQSVLWQQAIGMGLPVVLGETSDIQPHRQNAGYLNLHENLIVLDPSKPRGPEIARHISALMSDPERVDRMSEGARKTAAEILDWDKLIEKTLQYNLVS